MIEQIKEYMVNNFQIDESAITPDAHLIDDLQLTSLDIMDIAMYIEEEFGVVLEEEDLAEISTVQSFMELLEKQQ
ncbi:MAG: acyl carrier protein [Firmicutes bacterium]|jgi:acyl carrier protein|nr:acyl carrier protein [Bacillota bacterium]